MKDEIIIVTLLGMEIDILQQLLDGLADAPSEIDGRYMSDNIYNRLCGHVETIKKLREKGWCAVSTDHNRERHQTVDMGYELSKDERIKGLREEADNWSSMYDEAREKNKKLEGENEELKKKNEKLESQLRDADNDYNRVNNSYLKSLRETDKLGQKIMLISMNCDTLKDKYDRCQTTINALTDDNREMVKQIDHIRDVLKMELSCNTKLDVIEDIVKIPDPNED